jgi:HK97 family phage portal protein
VAGKRALIPRDTVVDQPAVDVLPATAEQDDPAPVAAVSSGGMSVPRPQPWAGWPEDWVTPNWFGRVETLTDIAWACLDLNSSVAASMPPYLVGAAPTLDKSWLTNPDPDRYTSWEEFFRQLWWDYQACGEAVIVSTANYATGWPARFHLVPPWNVDIELDSAGIRRYRIGDLNVPRERICHIRYQGTVTDAHGRGPLEVGRARLVTANLLARYVSNLMAGGGVPTTTLVHPQELTAERAAELQAQWVQARIASMGLPAVLSGGLDFRSTGLSPSELALADLSAMTEARIAILLRVPPYLVGLPQSADSLVYNTAALTLDFHWRAHLRPLVRPVVAALSEWALPAGTTLELNRDAYVQPGPLEQAQTDQILVMTGIASVDEIRTQRRLGVAAPSQTLPSGVLQ